MALSSSWGCPAKLVRASASSTTARSPAKAASTISCIPRPTPPPGPSTTTLCRGSDRKAVSSAAPSTGRTMTARLAAALTASAARGEASVARPAPARSAARAASRAAPVDAIPPDTTTAWPRLYLCPSMRGIGKAYSPTALGTLRNVCGLTSDSTCAPMPISASRTSPQCSRPGSSRWPGLRRKKVMVVVGIDGDALDGAAGAIDAARQIHGMDGRAGGIHRLDHGAPDALDRPVEPGPKQRIDDDRGPRQAGRARRLDGGRPSCGPQVPRRP